MIIEAAGTPAIACSALLDLVFLVTCFMVGLIASIILVPLLLERLDGILHRSQILIELLPERLPANSLCECSFLKILQILIMSLLLCGKLLVKQCLLKLKLLFEQAFLEAVCQATRNPRTDQSADKCSTYTGIKKLVCHNDVRTRSNDPKLRHADRRVAPLVR